MEAIQIGGAALVALSGMPIGGRARRSGALHRTGAAVRSNSIEAGTFEDAFFPRLAAGETDRMLRGARKALDNANGLRRIARKGERKLTCAERVLARLTATAVRVFEELLTLARLNDGRVFPTYDYLVERTNLGRSTIQRAIPILEENGFILKQRRCKRIDASGPGPRYEQTSNAYRVLLPKVVIAMLPRWMRPAPLPVDQEQLASDRADETKAMLSTLSCKEFAEATVSGPMGKVLALLGAGIDRREREVQPGAQPLTDSYNKRKTVLA